mmetsp:Transcript_18629/g.52061  ORF Transcript_18629/g.52061 Transcript_18629/m.52061 type:complete len:204 (+) Transcript_18629:82-693(+)
MASSSTNITWHQSTVNQDDRWKLAGHKGAVVWFTGLSGAGKSSIANAVESTLNRKHKIRTYLLDGDNIRHGLCQDLGFSAEDRCENIRRVGQMSKLMADSGMVALAALVSPYKADRDGVRTMVEAMGVAFVEIHVEASVRTCEGRDPKGLYKMAREGKIKNFTGIDDPYEEPVAPELVLDSNHRSVAELAEETCAFLLEKIKL